MDSDPRQAQKIAEMPKSPLADFKPFENVAKSVGLRQLVKSGKLTHAQALSWLRANDPSPNPRIVLWLERHGRNA